MEQLNKRIDRGIEYFWGIKPSQWTPANTVHLKSFLSLVEKKRQLEEKQSENVKTAQELFKKNE